VLCLGRSLVAPAHAQEHGAARQDHAQTGARQGHENAASDDAHGGDPARAEHGHGPKYDLLSIDGMTAIWTIIIFLVLLVILRATAWKPIQKVLTERENFIRDSLAQAKADREAAEARLKEYAAKLDAAQKEAAAILEVGRRDAAAVKHRIEQDAKEEADRTIERAKREIGIASDNAVKDLYTLSAKLGTEIASRVIQKELNPADHERLIADSIKEFQAAARN
jgi:F-type H+-transporting ATPase subunit b